MKSTKEIFLSDVASHTMEVIKDDGVNRHLRFSDNGSFNCKFDLITWGGHLCVTGDCGTYVFSRVLDMFEFFRCKKEGELSINENYWGQKLLSICTTGGYKEFDPKRFQEVIKDYFDTHVEGFIDTADQTAKEQADELWESVENEVLDDLSNEHVAYSAASTFDEGDLRFEDLFEYSFDKPTHHYQWNLYAIVWGIKQYDLSKAEVATDINKDLSDIGKLNVWTVFQNVLDYPEQFVARRFEMITPTQDIFVHESLEVVRKWVKTEAAKFPQGPPVCMARSPEDAPAILESWL